MITLTEIRSQLAIQPKSRGNERVNSVPVRITNRWITHTKSHFSKVFVFDDEQKLRRFVDFYLECKSEFSFKTRLICESDGTVEVEVGSADEVDSDAAKRIVKIIDDIFSETRYLRFRSSVCNYESCTSNETKKRSIRRKTRYSKIS